MAVTEFGRGPSFAFMQFPGLLVYSYYCRPGGPLEDFEGFLSGLEVDRKLRMNSVGNIVVGGDFNAKSTAWGSDLEDARGRALGQFAASLGLWPENVGSTPTVAVGDRSSVMDVTFVRLSRRSSISGCRVRDDVYSGSDYRYIQYLSSPAIPLSLRPAQTNWLRKRLNAVDLERRLRSDSVVDQTLHGWWDDQGLTTEAAVLKAE